MFIAALLLTACETTTNADDGGQGGSGDGGAGGVVGPGGAGGSDEYVPTAGDIDFTAVAPIPQGEQILFNDWSFPDRLLSMGTDGSNAVEIFSAYRIWSVGVARGGDRLAFAVGDKEQEEHYGINLGDAIQHTFIYDFASQTAEVLAYGNINDECHHWGPGDASIYVCRRYDFMPDNTHGNYRLGRIDVDGGAFAFLVDEEPTILTLSPNVTDDGSEMYYMSVLISGGSQSRTGGQIRAPRWYARGGSQQRFHAGLGSVGYTVSVRRSQRQRGALRIRSQWRQCGQGG